MSRIVYVNGRYVPQAEATVSVFDRGFLMADAVYEVVTVIGRRLVDFPGHMARLERSLGELAIPRPAPADTILAIHRVMALERRTENRTRPAASGPSGSSRPVDHLVGPDRP